jgi:hypothetical protein
LSERSSDLEEEKIYEVNLRLMRGHQSSGSKNAYAFFSSSNFAALNSSETKLLSFRTLHFPVYIERGRAMQTILKVFSAFIGIFIIANGIWVVAMPPYGDEQWGIALVAVGIFIPALTLYVARKDEESEA